MTVEEMATAMRFTAPMGGATWSKRAFEKAWDEGWQLVIDDTHRRKIVLWVSDTVSSASQSPCDEIEQLLENNIEVVAINVGDSMDMNECAVYSEISIIPVENFTEGINSFMKKSEKRTK